MEYDVAFEFKTSITIRVKGEDHDDACGEAECEMAAAFDSDRWTEEAKLALEQAVMDRMDSDSFDDLIVSRHGVSVVEGQFYIEPIHEEA
jgi:hypothetical protein